MKHKILFAFLPMTIGLLLFACEKEKQIVPQTGTVATCFNRPVIQANLVPVGTLSKGRTDLIAAAANNKIIFAGGYAYNEPGAVPVLLASTRVDIYDITSNSWSTAELRAGGRSWEITSATVENKILIAGGREELDGPVTPFVDIYDASGNTWSMAELSVPRTGVGAATLGSKVFFTGGHLDNGISSRIDIYDNATNTWSMTALFEPRSNVSVTTAGGKVFVAGGVVYDSFDGEFATTKIDVFDAATNTWSASAMKAPRNSMASIAVGNKIFWAGGVSLSLASSMSSYAEIRDITTGASTLACMIPRSGLQAVLKDDNVIFFTGYGTDERNGTHFEIYNITTNTWSTGVLNQKIQGAAIISINNTVYVAGGWDGAAHDYFNQVWKLEF